jgi:hypothetical protein
MDAYASYLLALHLAFAMPSSPPAIFSAPGVPSPSAPGVVHAAPNPSPVTPAVIHAPPMIGGSGYAVNGIEDSNINGLLIEVPAPNTTSILGLSPLPGTSYYTTDGNPARAASGYWVVLWRSSFITRADATISSIFPPGNYSPGLKVGPPAGTVVRVGSTDYILINSPVKWVAYNDETNADAGGVVVPAGTEIIFYSGTDNEAQIADTEISGGLAATWLADPATEYQWRLRQSFNNSYSFQGSWVGRGTAPETAAWGSSVYKPGTPVLTAVSGGLITPPAIHTPPGRSPGTPGAIHSAPAASPGTPPTVFTPP